jgi:hypothetical protein
MSPDPGEPFRDDFELGLPGQDTTRARIAAEVATTRAELARMDAKTNTLLAVCGILLGAAVAVLGKAGLPGPAATAGWAAAAAVAVALVLLLLAVRPNLAGNFGFVRWATAANGQAVLDAIAATFDDHARADELHRLALLLHGKYRTIRHAATLLILGLGLGAVTAVLTIWAR